MALRQFSSSLVTFGLKAQLNTCLPAFSVRGFSTVLDNLKYAKSHEWAKAEGDVAVIGISDHAQAELGDVVYVELPEVGKTLKKGETFGVVESVKAASDVYAPVSGEVTAVNEALKENPGSVNKEPYDGAWMIKIKMSNKGELNDLLDAAAYSKHSAH